MIIGSKSSICTRLLKLYPPRDILTTYYLEILDTSLFRANSRSLNNQVTECVDTKAGGIISQWQKSKSGDIKQADFIPQ